jgi:DNA-binding CsgD family transcriptional regulator
MVYVNKQLKPITGSRNLAHYTTLNELTEAELITLQEIRLGKSNSEIAKKTGVKETTINQRILTIREKLDIRSKKDLVVWAQENIRSDQIDKKEINTIIRTKLD